MDGWPITTIGKECEVKGGKRLPKGATLQTEPNQHPYIRVVDMRNGRIKTSELQYVPDDVFPTISRYTVSAGDVVISIVGTIGTLAIVPSELDGANLTENAAKIRNVTGELDLGFLFYYLSSHKGQTEIIARTVGSTQPKLALFRIKDIPVPKPNLETQKKIAHILGTLDDKIELNRKMNQRLEAIARAIFKSWFVDFDPVIDNALVAGKPIPEQFAERAARRAQLVHGKSSLPENIRRLFPDEFQNSELGPIPKGWKTASFADTVEILSGGTPKTSVPEYWGGEIPWFSVTDVPQESDVFVIDTKKKVTQAGVEGSSTRILPKGTTIITARGTVGKVALAGIPIAMNQSCYGLRGCHDKLGYFTYYSTRNLVSLLQQNVHGSVFDTITRKTFSDVIIIMPPQVVIAEFEAYVEPFLMRILSNLYESERLACSRNNLLPRLLSGKLLVQERNNA